MAIIGNKILDITNKGFNLRLLMKYPNGYEKNITAKNLYEIRSAISESEKLFLDR